MAERRFGAMGTTCHLIVEGGPPRSLDLAEQRIQLLEERWSRFLPTSDVSALNRSLGEPTPVSEDTALLVRAAVSAFQHTDGAFDPTIVDTLSSLGYDRPRQSAGFGVARGTPHPSPGCAGVVVDGAIVRLPLGVRFDPGGIGKGLAADIVVDEMMGAGVDRIVVNIGGDLRAAGGPLAVAVTHGPPCVIELDGGAIATSTTLERRWRCGTDSIHHLIDPATGRPTGRRWDTATVIAGEAWWAEAVTKSLLVRGRTGALGAPHRLVADRDVVTGGGFDAYARAA